MRLPGLVLRIANSDSGRCGAPAATAAIAIAVAVAVTVTVTLAIALAIAFAPALAGPIAFALCRSLALAPSWGGAGGPPWSAIRTDTAVGLLTGGLAGGAFFRGLGRSGIAVAVRAIGVLAKRGSGAHQQCRYHGDHSIRFHFVWWLDWLWFPNALNYGPSMS